MRLILVVLAFAVVTSGSLIDSIKQFGSNASDAFCSAFASIIPSFGDPTIDQVSFQLRTPCDVLEIPAAEAAKFRNMTQFDIEKETVVFVTGFLIPADTNYAVEMAKAYNCRGGYNFIVVNFEGLLTKSVFKEVKLGELIAIGLRNLGVNGERIHLIGHSLGAHIVGSAGRYYANQTGDQIGRITGLDPARPCFVGNPAYPRIARGDAKFVDIIHSNPGDLGTEENIADADFYAGGLDVTKPGCSSISIICSHIIGVYYYIESVYPNNEYDFVGQKCGNFSDLETKNCTRTSAPMGFAASSNFKGIYYVDVRDQSPYGTNATSSPFVEYEKCGMCPQ